MRRSKLFNAADSSESPAAQAPAQQPADAARAAVPVSEEFKQAFAALGVRPVGVKKLSPGALRARREAAATDRESSSSSSSSRPSSSSDEPQRRQPQRRQRYDDDNDDAGRDGGSWRDRPHSSSSSSSSSRQNGSSEEQPWREPQRRQRYDNDNDDAGRDGDSSRDRPRSSSSSSGSRGGRSRFGDDERRPWQDRSRGDSDGASERRPWSDRGSSGDGDAAASAAERRPWQDRSRGDGDAAERRPWQDRERGRGDSDGAAERRPWQDREGGRGDRDTTSSERRPWQDRGSRGDSGDGSSERRPWLDRSSRGDGDGSSERRPWLDRSSRGDSGDGSSERRPWLDRSSRGDRPAAADDGARWPRDGRASHENVRRRWEKEAEERARLSEEEERKRLARKERSEKIPTKPKPKQDKVIFQAMTRQWDEKASLEEKRGARASARKIARIGIYDRNKGLKAVRRKAIRSPEALPTAKDEEEAARIAANAARQIQEAAAKSIQPTKEALAAAAAGVKRDFSRAEALPAGEWERLKAEYKTIKTPIKIGRRGATPALIEQIQNAWRGKEVVKLAIHDERSSRKMNLPRMNLLLKELEEMSGGVLVDCAGSSIWLYRGVDWVPPPVKPMYKPPPAHELFTQEHTPRGSWKDIAGISCYVVGSSEAAGLTRPPSSSSSSGSKGSPEKDGSSAEAGSSEAGDSSSSISISSSDVMTVLLLPDQFSFKDSPLLLQMADRVASKGALVIMPDLLGPVAKAPNSNIRTNGQTPATKNGAYWFMHHWPLVKKRKLEYFDWYNKGPASWPEQRPRLLQLLQEMQQQGLYDPAAAAAAAAAESSSSGEDAAQQSSSSGSGSSSSSGRPLGILGLGWGTYIGFRAAGDDECIAAGINAVAAMSPVTFLKDYDLATGLQLPVALLPAKYDPMEVLMMTIDLLQRPYASRCIFKRYGKVKPGWAHWLPQWIDNRAMYQAAEQMLMSVAWLKRELLGEDSDILPPPLSAADKAAAQAAAAEQQAADAADAAEDEAADETVDEAADEAGDKAADEADAAGANEQEGAGEQDGEADQE